MRVLAPKLNGDLRALMLAYNSSASLAVPPALLPALEQVLARTRQIMQAEQAEHKEKAATASTSTAETSTASTTSTEESTPQDGKNKPQFCFKHITIIIIVEISFNYNVF